MECLIFDEMDLVSYGQPINFIKPLRLSRDRCINQLVSVTLELHNYMMLML